MSRGILLIWFLVEEEDECLEVVEEEDEVGSVECP